MPAPVPSESTTLAPQLSKLVQRIYAHYVWIARFVIEMDAEVQLDLKKAAQLVRINGPQFLDDTAAPSLALRSAVISKFAEEGLDWPEIATEFPALRTALQAFFAYVQANHPRVFSEDAIGEVFIHNQGFLTDRPILVNKPAALQVEIAKLRALFA